MLLKKGMYAYGKKDGRFGLTFGQLRRSKCPVDVHEIVHNGRWYNSHGKQLGDGDLSAEDFHNILNGLKPSEKFLICREGYSRDEIDLTPSEVAEKCSFIITSETIYYVPAENEILFPRIPAKVITRNRAIKILKNK